MCEQYSTQEIQLCLDGLAVVGKAIGSLGIEATLDYFAQRMTEDPEGFERAVKALGLLPIDLTMDLSGLDDQLRAAFLTRTDDLAAINAAVERYIGDQLISLGKGEITATTATLLVTAAVAAAVKIAPANLRQKVFGSLRGVVKGMTGIGSAAAGKAGSSVLDAVEKTAAKSTSLWTRAEVNGFRVYQRSDLINPTALRIQPV